MSLEIHTSFLGFSNHLVPFLNVKRKESEREREEEGERGNRHLEQKLNLKSRNLSTLRLTHTSHS